MDMDEVYAAQGAEIQYSRASFRAFAILIDTAIAWVLGLIIFAVIDLLLGGLIEESLGFLVPFYSLVFGIEILHLTLLLGRYGQSVGMFLVKFGDPSGHSIKVVKEADSSPISYGDAFVRTILLFVDAVPYLIPFLLGAVLIWTSDKKQRLGDRIAHTIVVLA